MSEPHAISRPAPGGAVAGAVAGAPPGAVEPLRRMPDGTVKQVSPLTGTQVWTVPGRADRPLAVPAPDDRPVDHDLDGHRCAFCTGRLLDTPPEKARVVLRDGAPVVLPGLDADALAAQARGADAADAATDAPTDAGPYVARRIPNLFEILPYSSWVTNHGHHPSPAARARHAAYVESPAGRAHLLAVAGARARAAGDTGWDHRPEAERLADTMAFFAGGHDVVVGRRHLTDDATTEGDLASSGTLTPAEHHAYLALTVDAVRALYAEYPDAAYVAAFQNWLRPAGASFDHLHKQLVAIDELGTQTEQELARLATEPDLFTRYGPEYAQAQGLVVARTEHAVAFAGFGHRYPSLEVHLTSSHAAPHEATPEQVRSLSDLLHAVHAATGAGVPCNEEWHHRPPGVDAPMPWRVVVKWRTATLAGFEGATKIYLTTIDPWTLRDRVVARLRDLADTGVVADGIALP